MHILVIYDIPVSRQRLKIIDACMDYGLDRLQYSVFEGVLTARQQAGLAARIQALMKNQQGEVILLPVSTDDWARRITIGQTARPSPAPPIKAEPKPDDYPF